MKSLSPILFVALGGALGALARFGVATLIPRRGLDAFPTATLLINVSGCAVIGFFLAALNGRFSALPAGWSYLVPIGFIGAYTTFSTYAYELYSLLDAGAWARLASYFVLSNALGFAGVIAGVWLGRRV